MPASVDLIPEDLHRPQEVNAGSCGAGDAFPTSPAEAFAAQQQTQEDRHMTDTSPRGSASTGTGQPSDRTLWAGWVAFAGLLLMTIGVFQVTQGLVALFDDGFYAVGPNRLVVEVDYNVWGWVHIGLGVIGGLVGLGLLVGNLAARIAGVVIAFLSALVNVAFTSAHPLWSAMVIIMNIIVIYAIIVHGRELEEF
jgi:hypothetical protein